jgi:membrane fusion protein (multidrug efflux system)
MYVDVELVLSQKSDAVLLSKRALVLDGDQTYAFRLGDDRRVQRLLVEPRASDRFHVEPAAGFKPGDQVVVAGQTGLKDGARVRLPEDPEPGSTNAPAGAARGQGLKAHGRESPGMPPAVRPVLLRHQPARGGADDLHRRWSSDSSRPSACR